MPYKIRKAPSTKTRKAPRYWVVGPKNKHFSKEPLPLGRAKAQRTALYISEARKTRRR